MIVSLGIGTRRHLQLHGNTHVGNLPWSTTDAELGDLFNRIGPVNSARVVTDRDTGRSRGFGFVEMSQQDGRRAIEELNSTQIDGRTIRVNEANEQKQRPQSARRY
jgi:RNA recognition motif-containing protein